MEGNPIDSSHPSPECRRRALRPSRAPVGKWARMRAGEGACWTLSERTAGALLWVRPGVGLGVPEHIHAPWRVRRLDFSLPHTVLLGHMSGNDEGHRAVSLRRARRPAPRSSASYRMRRGQGRAETAVVALQRHGLGRSLCEAQTGTYSGWGGILGTGAPTSTEHGVASPQARGLRAGRCVDGPAQNDPRTLASRWLWDTAGAQVARVTHCARAQGWPHSG